MSNFSSTRYFTNGPSAPPATPTLLSPANGAIAGGTEVLLKWDAPRAADIYLQIATDPSFAPETLIYSNWLGGRYSGIWLINRPDNGTVYYWRVAAWNPLGTSSYSSTWYFVNGPSAPPETPTLISPPNGSIAGGTEVFLQWEAARAADFYLQIATDPSFAPETLVYSNWRGSSYPGTPFVNLPDNGRVYYWRVAAWNSLGTSSYSSTWYFTNGPSAPPEIPTLISPANGSTTGGTDVLFQWDAPRAADIYFELATDPSFAPETVVFGEWLGYGYSGITITGLPDNGTVYYWRVAAWNSAGTSNFSSPWYFTNGPSAPPATPTLISPSNGSTVAGTQVQLQWDAPRAADIYLQIATDASFAPHTLIYDDWLGGAYSAVQFIDLPDNGTVYYWRVAGWNSLGTSFFSNTWYFTNGPSGPPATPTLISPANGAIVSGTSVLFIWQHSQRAYDYYIEVASDISFNNIVYSGTTPYDFTVAYNVFSGSGGTYYWRVKARNALGDSSYSAIWTFVNSCVASVGSGNGVLTSKSHIDTCDDGSSYQLYDISRQKNQSQHNHSGQMPVGEAIFTESYVSGVVSDSDNVWNTSGQESAVDAHVHAAWVYDFLLPYHNSFDNKGSSMKSVVEVSVTPSGRACSDNAFWFGGQISVCTANNYLSLSGALDVIAHEWGHAVTDSNSNLEYEYEYGALNEAFSDWMGAAVEHANGEFNWTIGEGIVVIRDMSNPIVSSPPQPDTYLETSRYWKDLTTCSTPNSSNDYCWVHYNSGVPNKMFYLLSAGGTHPYTNIAVKGVGIENAFKIGFLANDTQWGRFTDFYDAYSGMVVIAENEFGVKSNEVYQVKNAWAAVNVVPLPLIDTSASPAAGGTTSGGGHHEWGSTVTVTATANSGYVFRDWTENGVVISKSPSYSFTVEGDRTLVANFNTTPPSISVNPASHDFGSIIVGEASPLQPFTVTNLGSEPLNIGGIGITGADVTEFLVSGDMCSGQTLAKDATCVVQAGFAPVSEGLKAAFLAIPSNDPDNALLEIPLTATADPVPTFLITASAGIGGVIAPSGPVEVASGGSQSFTITPDAGYYIADVFVDDLSVGAVATYTFTNVTAGHTIEAFFLPVTGTFHTLTVNVTGQGTVTSVPAGIDCGTTCTSVYSNGTIVTLTATPEAGHIFTGWSSAECMGTGNCLVTMNADRSVSAVFESLAAPVDIVFVIDSTGSMWDDIDYVKSSAAEIVSSIDFSVSDYRVAIADFKDFPVSPYGQPNDYPYQAVLPFSADNNDIMNALQSLSASGGGDWDESVYSALIGAIGTEGLGSWRADAKKSIVLMGDAPPHDPEPYTGYVMDDVIAAANSVDIIVGQPITAPVSGSESGFSEGVSIYSIVIGTDATAASYFSELSANTGGKAFSAATAEDVVDEILDALGDIVGTGPPRCDAAVADVPKLWPPNHKMHEVGIINIFDPDDDPVEVWITGITQDEPVLGAGSGNTYPDGYGVGTDTAWVRTERTGKENGRVYEIHFTATDGIDGECSGSVLVCVSHDQGENIACGNDGQDYDSTSASSTPKPGKGGSGGSKGKSKK
jgi:hypothetical protein